MSPPAPDSTRHATPDVYAPPADERTAPRAVYFHVPFCLHRCGYCDFTLVADRDELIPAWLEALSNELATQHQVCQVDTIFVGGGTPTHLPPADLDSFLQLVRRYFSLNPGGEFSVEANPDGLDSARLDVLTRYGVNRLSLGLQSFDDAVLKTLERQHTTGDAIDCIHRCRDAVPNLSIDLIFGVPGQSHDCWDATLQQAVQLPVTHISTYGLTFETGTDFTRRLRQGTLTSLPDETERSMYAATMDRLPAAGFEHYEISNFARPGFRCRHNAVYWNAGEYFAFGPGAARYVNGVRSTNRRNTVAWIKHWKSCEPTLQDVESLTGEQRAREAIMLGLRLVTGFHLQTFADRFEVSVQALADDALTRNIDAGMVAITNGCLHLTREGRFLADSVVLDFL